MELKNGLDPRSLDLEFVNCVSTPFPYRKALKPMALTEGPEACNPTSRTEGPPEARTPKDHKGMKIVPLICEHRIYEPTLPPHRKALKPIPLNEVPNSYNPTSSKKNTDLSQASTPRLPTKRSQNANWFVLYTRISKPSKFDVYKNNQRPTRLICPEKYRPFPSTHPETARQKTSKCKLIRTLHTNLKTIKIRRLQE